MMHKRYRKLKGLLSFVFVALVACTSAETAPPSMENEAPPEIQVGNLRVGVAIDDLEVGHPRIPFVLSEASGETPNVIDVDIVVFDLTSDSPTPGWRGEAQLYDDYSMPYWVVYPELPRPGKWGIRAEAALEDGSTSLADFVVEAAEESFAPSLGEVPPASTNRTLETVPDIALLTSGQEPHPGLYRITVAEAMESGKPTIISFATPAFCTSALCAPVIDSVEAVHDATGEQANAIHLEIYRDFETFEYSDEFIEWGLISEPWTFLLDSEGVIAAKFGGPVSPAELMEALEPLFSSYKGVNQ